MVEVCILIVDDTEKVHSWKKLFLTKRAGMEFFIKYKVVLIIIGFIACLAAVVAYFYFNKTKAIVLGKAKKNFGIATTGVKKVVLDNGMQVLMLKNNSVPKVLVQIAYNIGSAIEKEGERGLAHLLEHMIFKGTDKLSESDIDTISRKYGASYNAFTSIDVTSYYFEVDKNNWQPFVEILADCMQNARFEEQHLASELKAVIQELKMYKDSYWNVMFQKAFGLIFPANHPYHYPVIGYKEDLMNLSAANLKKFYKKYYHPNRATLFVIGDIDHAEVEQVVKEQFGKIVGSQENDVCQFPPLSLNLSSTKVTLYEDVTAEQLGFFCRIPGSLDKNEILSSAAAFLLGDGEGSRLYRALVDDKKIASSVGVSTYKLHSSGLFYILVEPVAGKADECRRLIRDEIMRAAKDGFTAQELDHMVKAKAKNFFMTLQKFTNIAYEWITSYFATGDEYAFFNRMNKYDAVTSAQVQGFINEHLNTDLFTQVEIVPLEKNMAALSEQAKLESDDLDKKILAKYQRTAPIEIPSYALTLHEPKPLNFTFPKPDKVFVLENGLKVLLKENKNLPLVTLECRFKKSFYNSVSLDSNKLGCMMSMLMEGSKGFSKEENVDFFDGYGADCYYSPSSSILSMLNFDLKAQIGRFIHILMQPTFPVDAFNKLRAMTEDSIARSKDSAQEVAIRTLKSSVYAGHPFGWTFDEALEQIKKLDVSVLRALHKELVCAENLLVTVVGDFDLAEMEAIIRKEFAVLPKGSLQEVVIPQVAFKPGEKVDVAMLRDQTVLALGQPSVMNVYHEDYVPVKLINYIGFSSLGSRLFQLREHSGLFYTAFGGWANGASKECGFDYIGAILSPDKVAQVEEQMSQLVNELAEKGVTEEELASSRQLYLKSLIDSVASCGSTALMFGMIEELGLGFDYYDKVLHRVQTITRDEINAVCKKYFTTKSMARIRVGRLS